jgi:hypothetical protein
MYLLFAQITRFLPTAPLAGVAQSLMERAEERAGHSPREAQQLRQAACAYLSVVR